MACRRNRPNVQPNKQVSPEGHRGKSLPCGNNYFHDLLWSRKLAFSKLTEYHTYYVMFLDKLFIKSNPLIIIAHGENYDN
jgi:hypothetical protein